MNYYWSCWYNKAQLKEMGANSALPAFFNGFRLLPDAQIYHWEKESAAYHYVFRADETLSLFIKLRADKPIIQIPEKYYYSIERGDNVKVGRKSKIGKAMFLCKLDF